MATPGSSRRNKLRIASRRSFTGSLLCLPIEIGLLRVIGPGWSPATTLLSSLEKSSHTTFPKNLELYILSLKADPSSSHEPIDSAKEPKVEVTKLGSRYYRRQMTGSTQERSRLPRRTRRSQPVSGSESNVGCVGECSRPVFNKGKPSRNGFSSELL
jgi:hypothetical protein